jgi:hypothetical protein
VNSAIFSKFTVGSGKMGNPRTNIDFTIFKNRMVDLMANFLNLVFLIALPKNDRQDLKWAVHTDAFRRQLQSVLKIGV